MKIRNSRLLLILPILIAALTTLSLLTAKPALAAGTDSWGDFYVCFNSAGLTEFKVKKNSQVYFYAVLTSAQTTELRGVFGDTKIATGGTTCTGIKDGTNTFPQKPTLGDMTD